jgi:hypothetical protein
MNETETIENLKELGESEYQTLKETYCRLQELRSDIGAIRDQYASDGTPPEFDKVEAVYLQVEELYAELERFLLPVCSVSACGPAMCATKN